MHTATMAKNFKNGRMRSCARTTDENIEFLKFKTNRNRHVLQVITQR